MREENEYSKLLLVLDTGLKQEGSLSGVVQPYFGESSQRIISCEGTQLTDKSKQSTDILGFADDLDIVGKSLENTANATRILKNKAQKIGLQIKNDKIKIMELLESYEDPRELDRLMYEKVKDQVFRYNIKYEK